jgi:hypothetical protein
MYSHHKNNNTCHHHGTQPSHDDGNLHLESLYSFFLFFFIYNSTYNVYRVRPPQERRNDDTHYRHSTQLPHDDGDRDRWQCLGYFLNSFFITLLTSLYSHYKNDNTLHHRGTSYNDGICVSSPRYSTNNYFLVDYMYGYWCILSLYIFHKLVNKLKNIWCPIVTYENTYWSYYDSYKSTKYLPTNAYIILESRLPASSGLHIWGQPTVLHYLLRLGRPI